MRQPFCQLQEEVMRRIAKFQKVSWEQFLEGWKDAFPNTEEEKIGKSMTGSVFREEQPQAAQAMIFSALLILN